MALKDNYLLEDHEMMADNLERLHKSFSQALDCATSAEFHNKDAILQSVNESLTMLMALNAKKIQREEYDRGMVTRGTMF
jgi:hypothetical protein